MKEKEKKKEKGGDCLYDEVPLFIKQLKYKENVATLRS
jgi:hypothetical protein